MGLRLKFRPLLSFHSRHIKKLGESVQKTERSVHKKYQRQTITTMTTYITTTHAIHYCILFWAIALARGVQHLISSRIKTVLESVSRAYNALVFLFLFYFHFFIYFLAILQELNVVMITQRFFPSSRQRTSWRHSLVIQDALHTYWSIWSEIATRATDLMRYKMSGQKYERKAKQSVCGEHKSHRRLRALKNKLVSVAFRGESLQVNQARVQSSLWSEALGPPRYARFGLNYTTIQPSQYKTPQWRCG